jgi:NAD(P)-dependent dehydrogenase (short-subunit alcohol dehydrogenase family)
MFDKTSRYYGLATVTATARDGREVVAVVRRRLPDTPGQPYAVVSGDQLDVIAERRFRGGTRFWHVADANSELEANELVAAVGRVIAVPER